MSDDRAPRATLICPANVAPERLSAWRDGLASPDEARFLAAHSAACPACGARLRDYDRIGAALRGQIIPQSDVDPWPAMRERIARGQRGFRLAPGPALGGVGALVAAALLVALFAGLLTHLPRRQPATGLTPTPLVTQTASVAPVSGAGWTSIPGYSGVRGLAVAPSDPRVAYQIWFNSSGASDGSGSGISLRATSDQGATWRALTPPRIANATYPVIGYAMDGWVSPFDSSIVFLRIAAQMNDTKAACTSNGGGQYGVCQFDFISVDGGVNWRLLSLPVAGSFYFLDGQTDTGARHLYAQVAPSGQSGVRIVVSDDGGVTWRLADSALVASGQSVTFVAPTQSGSTIFALSEPPNTAPASSPTLTVWRSDDAGASWSQTATAPQGIVLDVRAATVVNSGKPILYLLMQNSTTNAVERVMGGLFGADFQTAPTPSSSCTPANVTAFVGVRDDGSVLLWCEGSVQSWLAEPQRAEPSWATLTQDSATTSLPHSFTQAQPDGSLKLWLVIDDNKQATVEYATIR